MAHLQRNLLTKGTLPRIRAFSSEGTYAIWYQPFTVTFLAGNWITICGMEICENHEHNNKGVRMTFEVKNIIIDCWMLDTKMILFIQQT